MLEDCLGAFKNHLNCTFRNMASRYAKRKSDGCPITIMKRVAENPSSIGDISPPDNDVFIVDTHEEGTVRRVRLRRQDIGHISQLELQARGIVNAASPVRFST